IEFKRVLANLMDNGVQATGAGGEVIVRLSCEANGLLMSVEDDGTGIPADVLPRLGTRGFTFGKKDGSGLGLWHAKRSAAAWNGELEIVSDPDQGTKVVL